MRMNRKMGWVAVILGALILPAGPLARAQGITQEQAEAILNELKQIRQLLEQLLKVNPPPRVAATDSPPTKVRINIAQAHGLGREDAPLTLVEFTDYQCVYCQKFHLTAFEELKRNYIDTGKLRFLHLDLPILQHSLRAAHAARCAGEQGKFWEMRHLLIANASPPGEESLFEHAQRLALEINSFRACLDNGKYAAEIQRDIAEASSAGINATPTFVLGRTAKDRLEGSKIVGIQPYAAFEARIKELFSTGQ